MSMSVLFFFFFQAEDGIRDYKVTGVQTCALPICLALPRAGVGVGALAAHRQAAAVADAAVGADVHEALDVHRDLAPQVALDLQLALDDLAHPRRLLVRPRLDPFVAVDVGLLEDVDRGGLADPVDVRDRNLPALLPRQIHTRHSRHGLSSRSLERRLRRRNPVVSMSWGRHRRGPPGPPPKCSLPLPLLVPRILADDPHDPAPLDDLAVLAAHLDRRSHFHLLAPT